MVRIPHDGSDRALSSAVVPDCGIRPRSTVLRARRPICKRFEEAVGLACEKPPVRRVARQFGLREYGCGRSICGISSAGRRGDADRRCGRWEWMRSTLGKKQKFLTVVTNLERENRCWFGRDVRKRRWMSFSRST